MKTLYLDLSMGAAGDMFSAALYELLEENAREEFLAEINGAGIPGVTVAANRAVRCSIQGTHMDVRIAGEVEHSEDCGAQGHHPQHHHDHGEQEHCHGGHGHDHGEQEHHHGEGGNHHHEHRSMAAITALIDRLAVSEKVKSDGKAVYRILADAESRAHGMEVTEIHFHEVGMMDAIADITSACLLMEKLAPDRVIASPVCTGYGQVRASHGIIPVPAPATAYILEEIPSYEGELRAELCTPTGAALVRYFADSFGQMPVMDRKRTGYGMGNKEFERCNALRAVLGREAETEPGSERDASLEDPSGTDQVTELSVTVDDMTGEEIGFACEQLFAAGALDVYTSSVFMKKGRPGTVICVLTRVSDKEKILRAIFRYTSTIGVREVLCGRYILRRRIETVETPFGSVRKKVSEGYGVKREKLEYEDLAAIAREQGMSLTAVKEAIREQEGKDEV